jgi:hypothetical protein
MFRPTAETMFSKLSKAGLLSLASASERKAFYRGLTDPEMLRLQYEWSFWGRPVRRCRNLLAYPEDALLRHCVGGPILSGFGNAVAQTRIGARGDSAAGSFLWRATKPGS